MHNKYLDSLLLISTNPKAFKIYLAIKLKRINICVYMHKYTFQPRMYIENTINVKKNQKK